MMVGIALVMAAGCVYNNYLDRGIDAHMDRTKQRALVIGSVSASRALSYGTVLAVLGALTLWLGTNPFTTTIAVFGFFAYVVVYGYAKRHTVHGTLVGSISGAVPPVVGYVSVTGHIDLAATLLFTALVFWQMPHFYAIAIFRQTDYAAAKLPVLPLKRGHLAAKRQIMGYIIAFIMATLAFTAVGYAGLVHAVVMTIVGVLWLGRAWQGFRTRDDTMWARRLFGFSLIVLLVFSIMLSLNVMLP